MIRTEGTKPVLRASYVGQPPSAVVLSIRDVPISLPTSLKGVLP